MSDDGTMVDLIAPNGQVIVGTHETASATCSVGGWRNEDGTIGYDHSGDTDYSDPDTETTPDGEPLFVDYDGNLWRQSQLFVDGEEIPAETTEKPWKDDRTKAVLDDRELAAVLAGLRLLQLNLARGTVGPAITDVLTNGGTVKLLEMDEIDDLCSRLNGEEGEEEEEEEDEVEELIRTTPAD